MEKGWQKSIGSKALLSFAQNQANAVGLPAGQGASSSGGVVVQLARSIQDPLARLFGDLDSRYVVQDERNRRPGHSGLAGHILASGLSTTQDNLPTTFLHDWRRMHEGNPRY